MVRGNFPRQRGVVLNHFKRRANRAARVSTISLVPRASVVNLTDQRHINYGHSSHFGDVNLASLELHRTDSPLFRDLRNC